MTEPAEGLPHACKEWAAICLALAQGKQSLLLRKGGVAEPDGDFRVAHTRFWLLPTYTHQQEADGLQPDAQPLLAEALAARPPAGVIRLTHFAEVLGVYHVRALTPALLLAHLHLWSRATVEKRFHYRTPGLFVLPVRVWRAPAPVELPESEYYRGCHTWVELERALPTAGATPVLPDSAIDDLRWNLDTLLNPTAFA
jgi:hypothetical protein